MCSKDFLLVSEMSKFSTGSVAVSGHSPEMMKKKIHSFSCLHLSLCHILVHLLRISLSQNVLYKGFLLVNTNNVTTYIDVTHFEAYLLNGFLLQSKNCPI